LRVTEGFEPNAFEIAPFFFLHNAAGHLSFRGSNVPVYCRIQKVKGKKAGGEKNIKARLRENENEVRYR
jgi:hypothetical protein